MIFRAFCGEPVPGGARARGGPPPPRRRSPSTRRPARSRTPTSASPGPEHHIAERARADEGRDGRARGRCAIIGGVAPDPVRSTDVARRRSSSRRSPTRSSARSTPSDGLHVFGLVLGAVLALGGHRASPTRSGCVQPGHSARASASASRPLHRLFVNKWYFDELDRRRSSCGPCAWFGRFGQQTFERVVVNGVLRRRHDRRSCAAGSAAVRGAADRLPARLRRAARARPRRRRPLLPASQSADRAPLDPPLAPARRRARRRSAAGRARRAAVALAGSVARARATRSSLRRPTSTRGKAGLQYVTDEMWIARAGHPLQARRRRAEPVPRRC